MKARFEHIFAQIIKALDVPVAKTSASERLQSHPDEGSLLAYSETLNHYKTENAGIKADKKKLQAHCVVRGISARRHIPSGKRSHTPPRLLLNITKG